MNTTATIDVVVAAVYVVRFGVIIILILVIGSCLFFFGAKSFLLYEWTVHSVDVAAGDEKANGTMQTALVSASADMEDSTCSTDGMKANLRC